MRRRTFLSSVAVLAASVFAAGCGRESGGEPVATTEVTMVKSYRFEPRTIEVEAGSAVTWTNEDNLTHTVQVDGEEDHEVGKGESVSLTFGTPGTYGYVCTLHRQDMTGEVIVK